MIWYTNDPQKKYRLGTDSKHILLEGLSRFHCANLALSSDVDQDIDVWFAWKTSNEHIDLDRFDKSQRKKVL